MHVGLQVMSLPRYYFSIPLGHIIQVFYPKCNLIIVSTDGIEPSSKAYESFVLPLNYADNGTNITENELKINSN